MEGIQAVRDARQVDGDDIAGRGLALTDHGAVLGVEGPDHGNVDLDPVAVVHLHLHPGDILREDGLGRTGIPAAAAIAHGTSGILLLHRRKLAFGSVLHRQGHVDVVAHIHAGVEVIHLAGGIGHGDLHLVVAGLLGGEGDGEGPVLFRLDVLLQDHIAPVRHLDGEVGAGEGVAGVALDLTRNLHLVALQIQFVVGIESEGESREDELVHTEVIADERRFSGLDAETEITVPQSLGQGEGAGNGAEFIGFQLQPAQFVTLGIGQDSLQGLVRHHGHLVHQVALVHDGLELQYITGIVGPPVPEDPAVRAVGIAFDVILIPIGVETQLLAGTESLPGTGLGGEGIISILVLGDDIPELLGQQGETVQMDDLRSDLPVTLPQDEPGLVQRLSGDVVRHIGGIPFRLPTQGEGQGVLVVPAHIADLAVDGFQGV